MTEMPAALVGIYDRFAQRGSRVIAAWPAKRHVTPLLRRWRVDGLEFEDAEAARGADYHRHTFRLHAFRTWDEAESWLRGDGGHDHGSLLRSCVECAPARADHEAAWSADSND
jgi:hypothetical protein